MKFLATFALLTQVLFSTNVFAHNCPTNSKVRFVIEARNSALEIGCDFSQSVVTCESKEACQKLSTKPCVTYIEHSDSFYKFTDIAYNARAHRATSCYTKPDDSRRCEIFLTNPGKCGELKSKAEAL